MFSLRLSKVYLILGSIKNPNDGGVRAMATLKTISIRLKSVKNIQKITQSMKMVSAAKYARAERELKQVKAMCENTKEFFLKAEIEPYEEAKKPPDKEKKFVYVAVTSDRGLCGAVHSSVAKVIRNAIKEPMDNVKIVCIGDKARSLLHRVYGRSFLFVCNEVGRLPPTFKDASIIANEILNSDFGFEKVSIVFNKFKTVVSFSTEQLYFYSLALLKQLQSIRDFKDDMDEEEDTLESFIEFSFATLLFYAMKEGACSEQSSRMTAMDNASKNAGDMISKLTLTFNRTRQAVITRELIEIISGASAL